jgi:hypothetical protein
MAQTKGLDVTKQLQFIGFTGVQAAANTFKEITIPTGVAPAGGFGLRVTDIEIEVSWAAMTGAVLSSSFSAQLTKDTQVAVLGYESKKKLSSYKMTMTGSVAGVIMQEGPTEMVINGELIVVEANVFMGFTSSGYGGVLTVSGRMYYEAVPLTELDILRILQG